MVITCVFRIKFIQRFISSNKSIPAIKTDMLILQWIEFSGFNSTLGTGQWIGHCFQSKPVRHVHSILGLGGGDTELDDFQHSLGSAAPTTATLRPPPAPAQAGGKRRGAWREPSCTRPECSALPHATRGEGSARCRGRTGSANERCATTRKKEARQATDVRSQLSPLTQPSPSDLGLSDVWTACNTLVRSGWRA